MGGKTPPAPIRRPEDQAGQRDPDPALFSVRSLLIVTISATTGLLSGFAAGVPVTILSMNSVSTALAITLGFVAGLASAAVGFITTAAALNTIVGRQPPRS